MSKYYVGLTIHNTFEVEAESEYEAEEKVRELSVYATLDEADYNITYVEELTSWASKLYYHYMTSQVRH